MTQTINFENGKRKTMTKAHYVSIEEEWLQRPLDGMTTGFVDRYWLTDLNGKLIFAGSSKKELRPLCNPHESIVKRLLELSDPERSPARSYRKVPHAIVRCDPDGRLKPPTDKPLATWQCSHVEAEQARWQDAISDLYHAAVPEKLRPTIDGSGCDSGDPLDITLEELQQVFNMLKNPQDYE